MKRSAFINLFMHLQLAAAGSLLGCGKESSTNVDAGGGDAQIATRDAGALADAARGDAGAPLDAGTMPADAGQSASGTVVPFRRSTVSRQSHAIVQLANGNVLVAGGTRFGRPLSGLNQADLYDFAAAGSVRPVGPMQDGRSGLEMTLLPSGQVLVTGGYGGTTPARWRTAELYDPATRVFSRIASEMSVARLGHGAFLMSTGSLAGKVLLVGGGALGSPMTVDVFDPTTSTFTPVTTTDAPMEREGQVFALLADESVLITGGREAAGAAATAASHVYVPSTATFRRVGDLLEGRLGPTATTLLDGRVLVTGGTAGATSTGSELATTELYDPVTARFVAGPTMRMPRRNHTAARLGSGRVLIAGGNPSSSTTTGTTELFVPGPDTFMPGADLTQALALIGSIPLTDGRVFLMGGQAVSGLVAQSSELFTD